jgi:hypothetical protein
MAVASNIYRLGIKELWSLLRVHDLHRCNCNARSA